MKNIFFLSLIIFFLLFSPQVYAQGVEANPTTTSSPDPYGLVTTGQEAFGSKEQGEMEKKDLTVLVGKVIGLALQFIGVLFLALMIYGGFLWMVGSKGGDKGEINKAKKTIIMAIIGLFIVLAAYIITSFVVKNIGSITGV